MLVQQLILNEDVGNIKAVVRMKIQKNITFLHINI